MTQEELNRELRLACLEGKIEEVKFLIKEGAKVNCKDKFGWTPLHIASYKGHTKIVKLLIKEGSVFEEKNRVGMTPLSLATKYGKTEIVDLLEQAMKEAS